MFSYQQQGSSTSGPAHISSLLLLSCTLPPTLQTTNHLVGEVLRLHMHTCRNKHRCTVYYVQTHIMPTNRHKKCPCIKHKNACTHRDSCIIASSGLSLCDENIQGLEGLEASEGERKRREGGWQKRRRDRKEVMRKNETQLEKKTSDRAKNKEG